MTTPTVRAMIVPVCSFILALLLAFSMGSPTRLLLARQSTSPSCSDPINLPICIRPIRSKGVGASTTDFSAATIASLQQGMNTIWATCCISFTLSLGKEVNLPANSFKNGKLGVATFDGQNVVPNEGLTDLFKQHNSKKCLNLFYANDIQASNLPAGSDLKGAALVGANGMIVDDNVSPGVNAHEVGHNLGLKDNDTAGNLMSGADQNGNPPTGLDATQCALAKTQAKRYLQQFSR
jgi:hypothetical protein